MTELHNILIVLVGAGWTVAGIIFWWTFRSALTRIEKKVEGQQIIQAKCKEELPEKYVMSKDYDPDNAEIWTAINHHSHDTEGRVIR